jgi:hypothetical protein
MFTDDLVDTSVPGEGDGRSTEWGSGVRRDGMIYHCMSFPFTFLFLASLEGIGS